MNRRHYLRLMAAAAAYAKLVGCMPPGQRSFPIVMGGTDHTLGHRLREGGFTGPVRTEEHEVVIVGGGIAGLSAARALHQGGLKDMLLLDLERTTGGNSRSGEGPHGAFPLAAHYLPLPDPADTELLNFLQECGVYKGNVPSTGYPLYGEEHLCADPHERLFHDGVWRSGLEPRHRLSEEEQADLERFASLVEGFAERKGSDGKWAFAVPMDRCSTAPDVQDVRALDKVTFRAWLDAQGLRSEALRWYMDYCCKDDYGAGAGHVSAFAGLHYFAARRGVAANAAPGHVLTWPQGNAFLADALARRSKPFTRMRQLVFAVRDTTNGVELDTLDAAREEVVRYRCQQAVLCVPQFVAAHLLGAAGKGRGRDLHYAPWVVVNLTLSHPPEERGGEAMAWDNVRYGSGSLGYINSSHQRLDRVPGPVLTHYRALTGTSAEEARRTAHSRTPEEWVEDALLELRLMHPDIEEQVKEAHVSLLGHGMVIPVPGLITGGDLQAWARPMGGIHFAHSDLSGFSIFEEAFHHGRRAAAEILQARGGA